MVDFSSIEGSENQLHVGVLLPGNPFFDTFFVVNLTFSGLPFNLPKPQARLSCTAVITVAVVALHAAVIWALQSSLLARTAELSVPVELVAQFIGQPEPAPAQIAPTPPAPAAVELPSSDADYLQNPKPAYPPLSKRLGEQGKVVVRVPIGVDGIAKSAELRQSSSVERLDRAALNTVLQWRYVPGKRAGVAEDM